MNISLEDRALILSGSAGMLPQTIDMPYGVPATVTPYGESKTVANPVAKDRSLEIAFTPFVGTPGRSHTTTTAADSMAVLPSKFQAFSLPIAHQFHLDDGDPSMKCVNFIPTKDIVDYSTIAHQFHPGDGDPFVARHLFHPDDGDPGDY